MTRSQVQIELLTDVINLYYQSLTTCFIQAFINVSSQFIHTIFSLWYHKVAIIFINILRGVTLFNLTRALKGEDSAPHLVFANHLKTEALRSAKFGIPAHNSRTHLMCKF